MSKRVQTITKIIEQRQPLAQKIEGVENNLESLTSALYKLENHHNEFVSQVDDPQHGDQTLRSILRVLLNFSVETNNIILEQDQQRLAELEQELWSKKDELEREIISLSTVLKNIQIMELTN